MPRKKSLMEQLLAERRLAKAARERANRAAQAEIDRQDRAERAAYDRAVAAERRQAAQREREAERRTVQERQAQERAAKQAETDERKRQQAEQKVTAAQASAEVARQRREAADRARVEREAARAEREQARAAKEQARADLVAAVAERNEELGTRLASLTGLLGGRVREPVISPLELEAVLSREGPDAFCAAVQTAVQGSAYPLGVPAGITVLGYRPEARELIVERQLPRDGVIPAELEVRVVQGEARTIARKPAEARHLYGQLLARTALRTLAEVFVVAPATLVDAVGLNGRVTAVDRATGRVINPHLVSVLFPREEFEKLNLDEPELDPELCLRAQHAQISDHPHDLVPVKPFMYYDLSRFKTIAGVDLLVDLDSRLDLLTLTPNEFETLIKQLFEARGLESWQTQASRDDGVDAIAINKDPIVGGVAIIQAKRYSKVVGYESVTALAGVMTDKGAARGILVTTSWVGSTSRVFAERNRIQIIDGRELKQLLAESLNMDVLISLPVLPRGWERAEIA